MHPKPAHQGSAPCCICAQSMLHAAQLPHDLDLYVMQATLRSVCDTGLAALLLGGAMLRCMVLAWCLHHLYWQE